MLRTENVVKRYKGRTVVGGASVAVRQGEIVGLLGPNGAGKTTTFYMIVGLVKPNSGRVMLDDTEITDMAMYKRAKLGIGYLPQEASVFRKLSVEDNIRAILEMTGKTPREQEMKLEQLLDEFSLNHVRKSMGDVLSGGERRRTEIARALANEPRFILLDEPFAGVDPIAVEDIQSIVSKLKEKNIGVLITDHNVNETLTITDRAYLLIQGHMFREGTAEELANDPQVRAQYLGRNFELRSTAGGGMKQFLDSLSPVELAFLMQYKYPGLSSESKDRVDDYLSSVFMKREELAGIYQRAQAGPMIIEEGACPRCGSFKLDIVEEQKVNTNRIEALSPYPSGETPTVERITCRVCDLTIDDPNARGAIV